MLVFPQTLYIVFAWSLIVLPVSLSFLITSIFQNRLNDQVPWKGKRNSRHETAGRSFCPGCFLNQQSL